MSHIIIYGEKKLILPTHFIAEFHISIKFSAVILNKL